MHIPFLGEKDLLRFKTLVNKGDAQTAANVLCKLRDIFLEIQEAPNKPFGVKVDAKRDYDAVGAVAFYLEKILKD